MVAAAGAESAQSQEPGTWNLIQVTHVGGRASFVFPEWEVEQLGLSSALIWGAGLAHGSLTHCAIVLAHVAKLRNGMSVSTTDTELFRWPCVFELE